MFKRKGRRGVKRVSNNVHKTAGFVKRYIPYLSKYLSVTQILGVLSEYYLRTRYWNMNYSTKRAIFLLPFLYCILIMKRTTYQFDFLRFQPLLEVTKIIKGSNKLLCVRKQREPK